jgi:hypothetical protein
MSVNDISGLPILEVFSDDRVVMGSFNKNTLVVTGSRVGIDKAVPTADLDISGSVFITGSLRISSGGITGSLFGTSSVATTASYVSPSGLPIGTVSSSAQINTGSFTGSFTGELIGTSSWASNAISSSFATTSSAATSITFTPLTASFSTSASYALSASYAPSAPGGGVTSLTAGNGLTGGEITSTGTITLDTGSVHFLDGVKKELNTEGVFSSSVQINTGSFTGSFTGTLIGTSSWATNAISASYFTGSVTFPSGLIVTGSILATTVSASLFLGPLTGTASNATSASYVLPSGLPTGTVSSSTQINTGSFSGSITTASFATTAATASSFTGYINFPNGLDVTGSLFVTGSGLIVSGTTNLVGSVTASRLLALSITGSLFGTASNAISSSYAVSASYAPSAPGSGITSITVSDGLSGGVITTTGTISLDTGSVHFLDGVKKELNTEGVVSSSLQINTGSFTGSVQILSGSVSSSGPQAGLFLSGSSTQLTILPDSDAVRYYARNAGHMFRVNNVDALSIEAFSLAPVSDNQATIGNSGVRWQTGYINNIASSGSITHTGSLNIVSGSINVTNGNFSLINGATSYATTYVGGTGYITNAIGSNIYFKVNTGNGLIFTGDNGVFGPNAINNISLGQPSARWNNTYTNNLFTSGSIIHTGSLNIVSGSVNVTNGGITGSVTGSFTGALQHFSPSTLKLTVGTTAPASPAVNDLWVDTN